MIKEIVKTADGKEIVLIRPETEAESKDLAKQAKKGEFEPGTSFGDIDDETEQDLVDAGILADE